MVILLIFCFYMTLNFGFRLRDCQEMMDFYWKAKKLTGKVIYWERRMDFLNWYSFPVYYYLEVRTESRIFRLVTDNPDAEKYREQEEIILLKGLNFIERMKIRHPELFEAKTEEEYQLLQKGIEQAREVDKIMDARPPIIEEDQKGIPDLLAILILAFGFGALTVIAVMILLKPYR